MPRSWADFCEQRLLCLAALTVLQLALFALLRSTSGSGDPVDALLWRSMQHARRGDYGSAYKAATRAVRLAEVEQGSAPDRWLMALLAQESAAAQLEIDEPWSSARLLAAARGHLSPDNVLYHAAHEAVFVRYVWNAMLRRAEAERAARPEEIEARFRRDLTNFETLLEKAGVDGDGASLGRLALAQWQWRNQRFAELAATLDSFEPVASDGRLPGAFAARYWNLRGLLDMELARFASALDDFDRALELLPVLPPSELARRVRNNLALCQLRLGDYRPARAMLEEIVAAYERQSATQRDVQGYVDALINLAKAIEGTDRDYQLASARLRAASNLARLRNDLYAQVHALSNLGVNAYLRGDFLAAKHYLDEGKQLAAAAFGEPHVRVAEFDVDLGWTAWALGRDDEAETHFRQALSGFNATVGDEHPRVAEVLAYLASWLTAHDRAVGAKAAIRDAIARRERLLDQMVRSTLSERDRLALLQEWRVHRESSAWPGVLDTFLQVAPRLGIAAEEQYQHVLSWKGVLARRPVATSADGATQQRPIEPVDVAAVLPIGTALLDIFAVRGEFAPFAQGLSTGDRYLAFLITPGASTKRLDVDWPIATVDGAVVKLRTDIGGRRASFGRSQNDAARLIQHPLLPELSGISQLIVAGDGAFYRLPWCVLPGERPGGFWIEEMAFANVLSSASLVQRRRMPAARRRGALIIGQVEYGDLKADFPPLAGSGKEAEAVADAFRRGFPMESLVALTHGKATEKRIKAELSSCRFAHLATHGFFPEAEPQGRWEIRDYYDRLESGLVLAPAAAGERQQGFDQYFTAEELGGLDLSALELLTLSACGTALGHESAGQGIFGLLGSIDQTGARAALTTLWPLDDRKATDLMRSFYRRLWSDRLPPIEALREAQLDMLQGRAGTSGGQSLGDPSLWAALVLVGDPWLAPPRVADN